ncbi:MAG: S8 family peptidase [Bacteroidales bacterium]
MTFGGNSTVAIIDSRFDIGHPDLASKFIVNYDPYSLVNHTTYSYIPNHDDNHGTFVASCAIAETDGGGQLASIGFDTEFYAYTWNNGIFKAHHASMILDVDVISISWFYDCSPDPSGVDSTIISDILNNGTIIVAAAGNGFHGASCSSGGGPPFSPLFPFSPTYDNRIICVSSIGEDNNHYFEDNGANQTHSYFPEVDICAPGYLVMGAQPSLNNQWPYFGGGKGTSFATLW